MGDHQTRDSSYSDVLPVLDRSVPVKLITPVLPGRQGTQLRGARELTPTPSTYNLSRKCLHSLSASFYLHSGLLQLVSGLCPLEQGAIVQLPPGASGLLSAERFSLRPGPLALCHLWAEDREPGLLAVKGAVHLQKTL